MTGVGSCGCPISFSAMHSSSPLYVFVHSVPISASTTDTMTLWITSHTVCSRLFIRIGWEVGFALNGLERKKCPPAWLLASSTNIKDMMECMCNTMLNALDQWRCVRRRA
eukprot:2161972-Ditylum_brightwellii.AAC.1